MRNWKNSVKGVGEEGGGSLRPHGECVTGLSCFNDVTPRFAGSRRPGRRRRLRSRGRTEFGRGRSRPDASREPPVRRRPWQSCATVRRSSDDVPHARRRSESDWTPTPTLCRRRRAEVSPCRVAVPPRQRPGCAPPPRTGSAGVRCGSSRIPAGDAATWVPRKDRGDRDRCTAPCRRRRASTYSDDRDVRGDGRNASPLTETWTPPRYDEVDVRQRCLSCTSPLPRSRRLSAE